ncbi:MAG TPA: hypothetical protein VN622_10520 [Clostridia bacterium]|nr:hypothetical protein [Clostridia bacterium]
MIFNLFDMVFGCWHRNYSFPITAKGSKRRSKAASLTGTYVVCLDCGKEFPYNWEEMKVIAAMPKQAAAISGESVETYANKAA